MLWESVKSVWRGEKKDYVGKDLPKSQVLSSEWKNERVREDGSCKIEDGEGDELLCMLGESEGDFLTRLAKISGVCSIDKVQHTEKSD